MIYKVFAVFDSKVGAYTVPRFARSTGEMLRIFSHTVNQTSDDNGIAANPEDYTLFQIGEYDDEKGAMISSSPVSLGVALEFKTESYMASPNGSLDVHAEAESRN